MASAAQGQAIDYLHVDGFEAAVDCSLNLACAAPGAGKVCIAGRLHDAGSGAPLQSFFNAGADCNEGAVGGACNLQLRAYDALSFAANPDATTPLSSSATKIDGCARFRFSNLDQSTFGQIAIVAESLPSAAFHERSARAVMVPTGQGLEQVEMLVARKDTVARWTTTAGSPFGASSFADLGAILFVFSAEGAPRAGVTVMQEGSAIPSQDYYFGDSAAAERRDVDSGLVQTGANGAVLVVNGALGNYSGVGGEPPGCFWPQRTTASVAGVVFHVPIGC